MLSRLVSSVLENLSVKDSISSNGPELLYPTLSFPPPPPVGTGTRSLCARCLTLLSHVIAQYGDGTGYKGIEILHSSSIPGPSQASQRNVKRQVRKNGASEVEILSTPPPCVICTKTLALFNAARTHGAFDPSLRNTSFSEWSLSWRVDAPDPKIYPQFALPHDSVSVLMSVKHKGGYGWGIGGFKIYPDWIATAARTAEHKANCGDYPVITALDPIKRAAEDSNDQRSELDFSSTLSTGSLALVSSWAHECTTSHPKCQKVFRSGGLGQPVPAWFPDRLIHVTRTESIEERQLSLSAGKITARVVLKSNPTDFAHDKAAARLNYLSFSHCWGPSPDPSAPLGGRAGTVLTQSNLSSWRIDLPLDDLPLAFRHAVVICASLGFQYMWIDSLCILQDSLEDWRTQSAVMGDVYKFAWLNVAAISTSSDYDGFINDSRDSRVEFGFRAPFASLFSSDHEKKNKDGQECILLHGRAKFLWNFASALPGSNQSNAPLFERAWVYQERSLARRTLAFAKTCVYWSCDECSRGERPDWATGGLESIGLRGYLHSVAETAAKFTDSSVEATVEPWQKKILPEKAQAMAEGFDMCWRSYVTAYTLCKLTKHTDKLIAFSSIARELANTQVLGRRYLAGLWDVNLPFQMAWITVDGESTPPRKKVGSADYVAPSWSWASIEAPVQPRFIFNSDNGLIALADVAAADVALETDFAFGSVKAGWLRVRGHLNRVKAAEIKGHSSWDKTKKACSLTDKTTGEKLWFCSDTVEGYELVKSGKGIQKIVWMPLTLRFDARMVDCICLCLIEVQAEDGKRGENGFVKTGEKVYRRLGSGNFGRIPSMLRQDKLLLSLGDYPDVQMKEVQGQELAKGFKRKEDEFKEFILI